MRAIFFIYWIWHAIMVFIQFGWVSFPDIWMGIAFGILKEGNLAFINLAIIMALITKTKANNSDYVFLIACIASAVSRWTIKFVGIAGSTSIETLLLIDTCTILIYVLLRKRLNSFSNDKWLSMYGDEK